MATVLLNMHMTLYEFLQETEDKGDHSSLEGDSDTEEQSTVTGMHISGYSFMCCGVVS